MVYFPESGLEIKLVAADNKEFAFPEHSGPTSGGTTFFEAEPNAEFFIAVRRHDDGNYDGPLTMRVRVDSQSQGFRQEFNNNSTGRWKYKGLLQKDNSGNGYYQALKFVTPRAAEPFYGGSTEDQANGSSTVEAKMGGEIIIKVRRIIGKKFVGVHNKRGSCSGRKLKTPELTGMVQEDLVKKKYVGVVSGTHVESSNQKNLSNMYESEVGEVIEKIHLKYATFERLLRSGIIPAPPSCGLAGSSVTSAADGRRSNSNNHTKKRSASKCVDLTLSDDDDEKEEDENAVSPITPPSKDSGKRVDRIESSSSYSKGRSARRTLFSGESDDDESNHWMKKKAKKKHDGHNSSTHSGVEPDVFILCDSEDDGN